MKLLNQLRITHKISALMVGLVMGFILIGITYYLQVNISEAARQAEKSAFLYQQSLSELNQIELNRRFQISQIDNLPTELAQSQMRSIDASIAAKLSALKAMDLGQTQKAQIETLEELLQEYRAAIAQRIATFAQFRDTSSAQKIRELSQNLAAMGETIATYNSMETTARFESFASHVNRFVNFTGGVDRTTVEKQIINTTEAIAADSQLALTTQQKIQLQSAIEVLGNRAIALVDDLHRANHMISSMQNKVDTLTENMSTHAEALLQAAVDEASTIFQASQAAVTAIIFFVAMGTAIGIYLIYKSIVFPITHMQSVIARINRGQTKARVKILSNDELADLGRAFNKLFDERIQQLETQSSENDRLNNSIISLIQALGAIAKKDLTIKVPVSSDITGTVSDAVNLLTSETAATLREVKNISREVNTTSDQLQQQSLRVMQFAESERMQIVATSKALKILAKAMTEVAQQSQVADESATLAIASSQSAKTAVGQAVEGIREIRETISETEKKTKRLGDRSQEISGIVNLINTIAERTHILALNASMHAASAGEAGKGFAVVAEEVQRLAESARESTAEITAMINNMRIETTDTVTVMNKLISQVADGSKLAELAGREMNKTEATTRDLVSVVKQIAKQAVQQASVANRVNDRSAIILGFTEQTEKQLHEQKIFTDNLKKYAEKLVQQVNIFRLPNDANASAQEKALGVASPQHNFGDELPPSTAAQTKIHAIKSAS